MIASLILAWCLASLAAGTLSSAAAPTGQPASKLSLSEDVLRIPHAAPGLLSTPTLSENVICTPGRLWRWRETCSENGPGTTAYRLAHLRLPDPLPELSLRALTPDPDEQVVPFTYAKVIDLPLSVYQHPVESSLGLPPTRIIYSGDHWVSVESETIFDGEKWYLINDGEFVRAEALAFAAPSRFQGIALTFPPSQAFAFAAQAFRPLATPDGRVNYDVPARSLREIVSIYARHVLETGDLWYMIGPDQWVHERYLRVVTPDSPPPGVGERERWIEIDLYEQTLAAYEGGNMVYATLVSSGRPGRSSTPPGLFRIWGKYPTRTMRNPDTVDGDPSYYYLEDVSWVSFFDGPIALHTAYWHNLFGSRQSHGCVNLAPRDSEWIFKWTTPHVPEGADGPVIVDDGGTWVWVHDTSPHN